MSTHVKFGFFVKNKRSLTIVRNLQFIDQTTIPWIQIEMNRNFFFSSLNK